ncbi:MAG TPA: hypothetical protein VFA34_16685 [Actinomycetota bacterium]|jgi:hypothetical protein|nr:hypothetical protein [Actinomycetota bacterium]
MPYVPTPDEARRLRAAIDRAAFSEAERIMWLLAFAGLVVLDGILLAGGGSWVGILGAIGGFAVLYWRLRGGHLVAVDRELHGIGLRTSGQRAFTALMLRSAFTGRNPLRKRAEHDPFARWGQVVERAQVSEEAASE